MNGPTESENQTHQVTTLLPWYVAGILETRERLEVEAHLSKCASCRKELEEMKRVQETIKGSVNELEGPSSAVFPKVMARIGEQRKAEKSPFPGIVTEQKGAWEHAESWLRSLFAPRWIPALASVLIIGQSVMLMMTWQGGPTTKGPGVGRVPGAIVERSVPQAPAPSQKYRVIFQDHAQAGEIRKLIQEVNGRVIDGPTSEGVYTIEVPVVHDNTVEQTIQVFRAQSHIVRLAEQEES
jgi:hypothetical protein